MFLEEERRSPLPEGLNAQLFMSLCIIEGYFNLEEG
jgi:hypothetical protein